MTYLELVQRLQSESGIGGNPIQSFAGLRGMAARLVGWVREADLLLQQRWVDWRFLWATATPIVTAAGARDYAPEGDLNAWERGALRLNGLPLELREYDAGLVDDGAQGEPWVACQLPNRQLRLFPTPDGAYTITGSYHRRPVAMTAEGSVSVIPAHFHMAIVWKALWLYANFDNAAESKLQAQEQLAELLLAMEAQELPGNLGHKLADAGPLVVRAQ